MGDVALEERFTHFPSDTGIYDNVGIIVGNNLLPEIGNPSNLKLLYCDDVVPDLHPLILYRVIGRGADGDFVTSASVSLSDFDRLVVGRTHLYIQQGKTSRDPSEEEIEKVGEYLHTFKNLSYATSPLNGQGEEVQISVRPINQIMELLNTQTGLLFGKPAQQSDGISTNL